MNLEKRDMYFSRLKFQVELFHRRSGEKTYLMAHSMGSIVAHFFLKWVESPLGGNGGPAWVDEHVAGFINIAGPLLGVPKTLSALISGEMKDTAELNTVLEYIRENLISTSDLLRLFRSFSSLSSMIPKGSDAIWGNSTWAPEDIYTSKGQFTHGKLVEMVDEAQFDEWKEPPPTETEITHQDDEAPYKEADILIDDDDGVRTTKCMRDSSDSL